jgi:hypothetical protein
VAIKVLPASLTNDEDRLRRFEQEAPAPSALIVRARKTDDLFLSAIKKGSL